MTDHFPAAVGGTYEFTRFASANLREKDDSMNTAIGGFLAGSVLGLRCEYLNEDIRSFLGPRLIALQLVQLLRSLDSAL